MNININEKKVKSLHKKVDKEYREFIKQLRSSKNTVIVNLILKGHLFVEVLIDEIIELYYTHPNYIEKSKYSYLEKVRLLRANNLIDEILYIKMLELNTLRNKVSHIFKVRITNKDIVNITSGVAKSKNISISEKLFKSISYIIGNIHFLKSFVRYYPFTISLLKNDKNFKKDKLYRSIRDELSKTIDKLDLTAWKR